jgi:anti-sigma B factor antagonist
MTNEASFEVVESAPPGVPILDVRGEIDVATSPELQQLLTALIAHGPELVIVDLTHVSFIDSTGLGVLVGAVRDVRADGGDIRLVVTQPQIIRLLELTGLDEVFSVVSSASEAVRT